MTNGLDAISCDILSAKAGANLDSGRGEKDNCFVG